MYVYVYVHMGAALFSRGGHELEGLDLFSFYIVSTKVNLHHALTIIQNIL